MVVQPQNGQLILMMNKYNNIWQPEQNESIYIASSTYSLMHDWVEGSLQSSNVLLQRGFNIHNPLADIQPCPPIVNPNPCIYGRSNDRFTCTPSLNDHQKDQIKIIKIIKIIIISSIIISCSRNNHE